MPQYSYYICDVFTEQRFGGNPLAVIPDARGLSDLQMQQVAREFNLSETTFVLPPEQGHTRRVRIFTPKTEMPFAGHPNIGTAFVLAQQGLLAVDPNQADDLRVVFEESAGLVPIHIQLASAGVLRCELQAPNPLTIGQTFSSGLLAAALSLPADAIKTTTHQPQVASVGLPFIMCQLTDLAALRKVRIDLAALDVIQVRGITPDIHAYVLTPDETDVDIHARMFAPFGGVAEDPATGSANCVLAALLSHYDASQDGYFRWRIAQGEDMGRPSVLEARTEKRAGEVTGVWIGGSSVMVAEGKIIV
jgi:trans-2,3-dihydro-3-hydroxyanthranilate isomerase